MTAPIDEDLGAVYDEVRTAATWKRIAAKRWPAMPALRRRRMLFGVGALTVALAATTAGLAVSAWPDAPRPTALTSHAASVSPGTVWADAGHEIVLDDDSRVALAAGARLQILANEGTRFATLLQAGSAHFDVHPGGPRRWEIETALASVEVVGTAFTVSVRDGHLDVTVERGVVLVHGERVPGRTVRLTAGQHVGVDAPLVQPPVPAPVPVPVPLPVPPPPPLPAKAHPMAVVAPPVPVRTPAPDSEADIIAKADQLTSAGDPAAAAALLEHARTSGLVAFTLGRLYLDALGKPELAAAAFDDVIARGVPRGLLEDAYARRTEAWLRAGKRDRAEAAIAAYATAYPQGRRLAALRALMPRP